MPADRNEDRLIDIILAPLNFLREISPVRVLGPLVEPSPPRVSVPPLLGRPSASMTVDEIQSEINKLLYDDATQRVLGATDREMLTIVILKEKAHFFDFLRGRTYWGVRGAWKEDGVLMEDNVQLDIEFKDRPDEAVGKRLIELLKEYNRKAVGETVLYARTLPVEEGTL